MPKYRSKRANHARAFNSVMHLVNEKWVAKVLGMQVNPHKGPDVIDSRKVLEVKFKLIYPYYTHVSWKSLGHQIKYNHQAQRKGKTAYWALGKYWLTKAVEDIHTSNHDELEALVEKREIYLVEWDWMSQFRAYHHQGKTPLSEWNHKIRFAKASPLPQVIQTYHVEGGLVRLTEGIQLEDFSLPQNSQVSPFGFVE